MYLRLFLKIHLMAEGEVLYFNIQLAEDSCTMFRRQQSGAVKSTLLEPVKTQDKNPSTRTYLLCDHGCFLNLSKHWFSSLLNGRYNS